MENNKIKNAYITIFNACKAINDYILDKEKKDDLDFIDHYMFQATSYVISIIHDDIILESKSYCKIFIYRSLIECVSVINMYMAGDVTEEAKELINKYCYLAEFGIYKKYKDELDGKQFDFEQIENNFKETKNIYRDNYDEINNAEFKNKIKSQLPFIKEDYSFDSVIQKYCNEFYQYYRIFSVMIHPNDILKSSKLISDLDFNTLELKLFMPILDAIAKYYSNCELPKSKTFNQEVKDVLSIPLNKDYSELVLAQEQACCDIANMVYDAYGNNQVSLFFRELGYCISSMATDRTFDFPEIVKCKFKMSIEMAATFYYVSLLNHTEEDQYLGELISKHTRIKIYEILGEDTKELWDDAYKCYLKSGNNISLDDFKKHFSDQMGFVPEKINITNFVYKLIDAVCGEDKTFAAHMRMVYDESQLLSHANGYMITANTGAFMEYSSVIVFMDSVIDTLMYLYWKINGMVNIFDGKNNNRFVYRINQYRKNFVRAAKKKAEMDKILNKLTMTSVNSEYTYFKK